MLFINIGKTISIITRKKVLQLLDSLIEKQKKALKNN